jgi:hypothetical protein
LGLDVDRIKARSPHFDGIAAGSASFFVEISTFPAVADGGPDLAPPDLRAHDIDGHAPAVAAGLVAIKLEEAIFAIRKFLLLCTKADLVSRAPNSRNLAVNGIIGIDLSLEWDATPPRAGTSPTQASTRPAPAWSLHTSPRRPPWFSWSA